MSLKKGQKYTLLNQNNDHWYFIKDQAGNTGYAPANHLEILSNYDNMPLSSVCGSAPNIRSAAHLEKE